MEEEPRSHLTISTGGRMGVEPDEVLSEQPTQRSHTPAILCLTSEPPVPSRYMRNIEGKLTPR